MNRGCHGGRNWACWLLCLLSALVGCGDEQYVAEGGIGGTGISSGPINGFGSIIVNGIRFDMGQAEVWINGQRASEADLRHGMVVTIYGDMDDELQTGMARQVVFDANLRGPVTAVDEAAQRLTVLGQPVQVNDLTVFSNGGLSQTQPGMLATVSGVAGMDGRLLATYVALQPVPVADAGSASGTDSAQSSDGSTQRPGFSDVDAVALSGDIQALDIDRRRFTLAGREIDYGFANYVDMQQPDLRNGLAVWVFGRVVDDRIQAEQIKPQPPLAATGKRVSLDGLIGVLTAPGRFTLRGVVVATDSHTRWRNGQPGELRADVRITVTGSVDESGVLKADEIRFRPARRIEIAAALDAVADDRLSLAGIAVSVTPRTLMLDSSRTALRTFSVTVLGVGDQLRVFGYQGEGGVVLTRLERLDALPRQRLSGPVTRLLTPPQVEILGVTVDAAAVSGAAQVLAPLQTGDWLRATGRLNGAVLVAEGLETLP